MPRRKGAAAAAPPVAAPKKEKKKLASAAPLPRPVRARDSANDDSDDDDDEEEEDEEEGSDMVQELRVMEENLKRNLAVDVSDPGFFSPLFLSFASSLLSSAFFPWQINVHLFDLTNSTRLGSARNRSRSAWRRSLSLRWSKSRLGSTRQ